MPTGQIFAGNPAKLLRAMTAEESAFIGKSALNYAALAAVHAAECNKTFEQIKTDMALVAAGNESTPDYDSHRGVTTSLPA